MRLSTLKQELPVLPSDKQNHKESCPQAQGSKPPGAAELQGDAPWPDLVLHGAAVLAVLHMCTTRVTEVLEKYITKIYKNNLRCPFKCLEMFGVAWASLGTQHSILVTVQGQVCLKRIATTKHLAEKTCNTGKRKVRKSHAHLVPRIQHDTTSVEQAP